MDVLSKVCNEIGSNQGNKTNEGNHPSHLIQGSPIPKFDSISNLVPKMDLKRKDSAKVNDLIQQKLKMFQGDF